MLVVLSLYWVWMGNYFGKNNLFEFLKIGNELGNKMWFFFYNFGLREIIIDYKLLLFWFLGFK